VKRKRLRRIAKKKLVRIMTNFIKGQMQEESLLRKVLPARPVK